MAPTLPDIPATVTVEPGSGHSQTADSIEVMRKYGTTENDMPASLQRELMAQVGFASIRQYLRISQLPLEDIGTWDGAIDQVRHNISLTYESTVGMTSIVVATKSGGAFDDPVPIDRISASLLELASVLDRHKQRPVTPVIEAAPREDADESFREATTEAHDIDDPVKDRGPVDGGESNRT